MFNFPSFIEENYKRVFAFVKTSGLQDADCEDICQDVWVELSKGFENGTIDVEKNIQAYLFKLVRWRIVDKVRRNSFRAKDIIEIGEENNLEELPTKDDSELEWKKNILKLAIKSVKLISKKKNYEIFSAQVLKGKDARQTAEHFKISIPTAYLAKHRVGKKVIAIAREMIRNGV